VKRWVCTALLLVSATGGAAADGKAVFDNNCAVCHQAGGVGVPGQFPRLAARAGTIAAKPEGKAFLPQVVLYGMGGRIMVDGEQILGAMPGFDSLSDDDIAGVVSLYGAPGTRKAEPAGARSAEDAPAESGYRETAHILKYYKTTEV